MDGIISNQELNQIVPTPPLGSKYMSIDEVTRDLNNLVPESCDLPSGRIRSFHIVTSDQAAIHVHREEIAAESSDYEEYEWIMQYATPNTCCKRPTREEMHKLSQSRLWDGEHSEIQACLPTTLARLVHVTVKTSAALTASLSCPLDHELQDAEEGDVKMAALMKTQLVYFLVFEATEHESGQLSTGTLNKVIKCGSRETAVARVLSECIFKGCWNLVFSCVMRHGECFDDRCGGLVWRVARLWDLAEDAVDERTIRVFY